MESFKIIDPKLTSSIALGGALAIWLGGKIAAKVAIDRGTPMLDLPNLGKPTTKKYEGRAIVCGGGLGGLMAAKMLTDHFDEVVVIESEQTFEDGGRKGMNLMQHNQIHAFGAVITQVWRKLWPTLDENIKKADGRVDIADNHLLIGPFSAPPLPPDFPYEWIAMSRPGAEAMLRRLDRQHPKIRFIQGFVTGLLPRPALQNSVGGVTYITDKSDANSKHQLEGSLVIDATGMACRGVKWLPDIGYQAPRRDYYDPHGSYSTAVVQLTPEVIKKIPWPVPYEKVAWILTAPGNPAANPRNLYMTRWEGDRICILACIFDHIEPVPTTKREIYEWARSCPLLPWHKEMLDILEEHIADMEIHRTKLGEFYHLRYDLLDRFPDNFIPIADSITKLNPVYGQGGYKASSDVCTLDGVLRRGRSQSSRKPFSPVPKGLSAQYIKKESTRAEVLLDFNKASDYGWPSTEIVFPGDKATWNRRIFQKWWPHVGVAAMADSNLYAVVQKVLHGIAPPARLLYPSVIWIVLTGKLSARWKA